MSNVTNKVLGNNPRHRWNENVYKFKPFAVLACPGRKAR